MERVYVIPLRKAYRASRPRRAKKAVRIVREFVARHMKAEVVVIGESVNREIWKRGMERPPRRIKVVATKDENVARVELFGHVERERKKAEKAGGAPKTEEKAEKKEAGEGGKEHAMKEAGKADEAVESPNAPETGEQKAGEDAAEEQVASGEPSGKDRGEEGKG